MDSSLNLSNSNTQDSTHNSISDGYSPRSRLSLSESGSAQFMDSTQSFGTLSDDESLRDSDEEEISNTFSFMGLDMEDDEDDHPEGIARLTSLNSSVAQELEEGDSEGEETSETVAKSSPESQAKNLMPNKAQPQTRQVVHLEPVGLFWDIENCPVPSISLPSLLPTRCGVSFSRERGRRSSCVSVTFPRRGRRS